MNIDEFRCMISDRKQKKSKLQAVLLCLNYVEDHPDLASTIGVFWNTDSSFIMNTSIFGNFMGWKPNTINRFFQVHDFSMKKTSSVMWKYFPQKFLNKNIPDQKHWIERKSKGFTKQTTEFEAINWNKKDLVYKKRTNTNDNEKTQKLHQNFQFTKSETTTTCQNENSNNFIASFNNVHETLNFFLPLHSKQNTYTKNDFYFLDEQQNNFLFLDEQNDSLLFSNVQKNNFFELDNPFKISNHINFDDCIISEEPKSFDLDFSKNLYD